jgi:hypothetical protein
LQRSSRVKVIWEMLSASAAARSRSDRFATKRGRPERNRPSAARASSISSWTAASAAIPTGADVAASSHEATDGDTSTT